MNIKVTINTASVQAKLDKWEKSRKGVGTIRSKIDEYAQNDVRETQAGSRVLTKKWVSELASELASSISSNAESLPSSVAANVQSVQAGGVHYMGGGAMMAELNFSGDLMRSSLLPEVYGNVNIVAIFEKGYHASGVVYGSWHGKSTHSLANREGLGFIESAVSEFNAKYGSLGITATVLGIYS